MNFRSMLCGASALMGLCAWAPNVAQALAVSSTVPALNASNQTRTTTITINFDRPLLTSSITSSSFRVWGRSTGPVAGTITYANGNQTLIFTPTSSFFPGEWIQVQMAKTITAADTTTLRSAGYALQFLTRAGTAAMTFIQIGSPSVRTNANTTRLYGGNYTDINRDGWIDYLAVNEVSADLRVMLNSANGSGLLMPVMTPPPAIGVEASPNRAADFNNDGFMDMATSNTSSGSMSVLLGNGNGTFQAQQQITTGGSPHGISALDVDGDGDLDLVSANENNNNLALSLNNGAGVFGAATTFDSGGSGEYPLVSADMNNDGITDLIVGAANSNQVRVMRGNGDGTFTLASSTAAGGRPWMLSVADLNNDGKMDIASANGNSGNASILLGNGLGGLAAPVTTTFNVTMIATDFGDLDGDGDQDWVLSSYSGSKWFIMRNDGTGTFSEIRQIQAPQAGSCASIYDFDNDGDLDMAMADELADVVLLEQNNGSILFSDSFETTAAQ